MDKNQLLRTVAIALVIMGLIWGVPKLFGGSGQTSTNLPQETFKNHPAFVPDSFDPRPPEQTTPWAPTDGATCTLKGKGFETDVMARGAAIARFRLTDPRYKGTPAEELSTTPDHERWRSLRTTFRGEGGEDQFAYDRFPWQLVSGSDSQCLFRYEDDAVKVDKTLRVGERPFEVVVQTQVWNRAKEAKSHRFGIEVFSYRKNEETKGSLGRQSPFITQLACARAKDVERKGPTDFKDGRFQFEKTDRWAAVTSMYFGQAIVPLEPSDVLPTCGLLAEPVTSHPGQSLDDDKAGHVYRARLQYPPKTLPPGADATYEQLAFFGPKDRDVLAQGAGSKRGLEELIDLGFFSGVAKVLVTALKWIHSHITMGNWGLAIIVMTIGVRLVLFPLTWKSIQTTISMRRLKPEVDALNAKFADDPQAKNLAMMELWRKHKVNPFGGCLPMLVQMPVWFAMYTTLQTAVEMYQVKFLWFKDLSEPDPYYIMPLVLGALMIVQQKIVPQQGLDPIQQKMMTWMLPIVFTVMMLFLPTALGVYMATNSVLGILQQLALEKFAPGAPATAGAIEVKQVKGDPGDKGSTGMGKGKARV